VRHRRHAERRRVNAPGSNASGQPSTFSSSPSSRLTVVSAAGWCRDSSSLERGQPRLRGGRQPWDPSTPSPGASFSSWPWSSYCPPRITHRLHTPRKSVVFVVAYLSLENAKDACTATVGITLDSMWFSKEY